MLQPTDSSDDHLGLCTGQNQPFRFSKLISSVPSAEPHHDLVFEKKKKPKNKNDLLKIYLWVETVGYSLYV